MSNSKRQKIEYQHRATINFIYEHLAQTKLDAKDEQTFKMMMVRGYQGFSYDEDELQLLEQYTRLALNDTLTDLEDTRAHMMEHSEVVFEDFERLVSASQDLVNLLKAFHEYKKEQF